MLESILTYDITVRHEAIFAEQEARLRRRLVAVADYIREAEASIAPMRHATRELHRALDAWPDTRDLHRILRAIRAIPADEVRLQDDRERPPGTSHEDAPDADVAAATWPMATSMPTADTHGADTSNPPTINATTTADVPSPDATLHGTQDEGDMAQWTA